ncbi:uncharacterized protein AB675_8632 [Cyphellophora attinorum]|uniref:ELYS-like domain-containing protein n=1 Tax=Cyphellophora attinorum TaxID=1664694 RepID=A0A0N1HG63_9EURO|nr:uncharacterized protein AB675_8632 [Phialophora attinorum]KPI44462.1 hypothetical protein AB675_8632 [Phialophora attinorum]
MYDWQNFDAVFHTKPDQSPDQKHAEAALKHRKELGGELFFDRMWTALRLPKPTKSYPPKSNAELRATWKAILKAQAGDEQKLALLYYLILDTRKQALQQTFAERSFIPQKYLVLVTGLWQLDQCHFPQALEYLTDPSLIPLTFSDEVLTVLLKHPKCDNALAMAFYLTVRPPLTDSSALYAYFDLLAGTNTTEAYYFAKSHPQHKNLFEKLIAHVYTSKASDERTSAALQLISLSFTTEEEAWFEEALLHGEASKTPGAKDSIMARRLAYGRLVNGSDALSRYKGSKLDGVDWETLRGIAGG